MLWNQEVVSGEGVPNQRRSTQEVPTEITACSKLCSTAGVETTVPPGCMDLYTRYINFDSFIK